MKIIHIVSSITSINFGVWNAATFCSSYLKETHSIQSELWICKESAQNKLKPEIPFYYFRRDQISGKGFRIWLSQFEKDKTIIVTHGAWLKTTHLGHYAKKAGYKWVYVSHGMLEPFTFEKGLIKKKLYFHLVEKRLCKKADAIRAVSKPEEDNLKRLIPTAKVVLVYNGVNLKPGSANPKGDKPVNFLFLARLHFKKGIYPLVKAWYNVMLNNPEFKLIIVGPDEGELVKISPMLKNNIEYLGPLFGESKMKVLQMAHYYILPTLAEGFPTSVVEAMSYGSIPIITDGCNFPEFFKNDLGYRIESYQQSIENILKLLSVKSYDHNLSRRNIEYVSNYLVEPVLGNKLLGMYKELLK